MGNKTSIFTEEQLEAYQVLIDVHKYRYLSLLKGLNPSKALGPDELHLAS